MDRYRASASSMSSVFSSSSVSNTPARQQESITNNQSMFTSGASELPQSAEPLEAALGLRATTLGTVVVRCGSIQLVIALLQSPDKIFIKVLELEPKITALGANLEESLQMKQEHDQVMRNVEDLPGPMEEFQQKANKLLASKRINIDVVNAMSDTLNIIWRDTIYLLHDRQQLLKKSCAFHEKMVHCQKYMDQLEAACIDAMLPIEVNTVQEVLNKFKQLRIDMLTAVMAALKEGNELLALLQELAQPESPGTRPEHIKRDAARAEHQVQCWLEALHDRRNGLEIAWQTRKTQLEQCLSLALLTREQQEVETALQKQRKEVMSGFTLGDCEQTANNGLHNYRDFKHQAQQLRDRALKITRGKEKLQASGTFSGDEACAKTYEVLNNCTEHLELVDQREHWLQQARDFFAKGTHTLEVLKKLEKELSRTEHNNNASESFTIFSKMSLDVNRFTEEPLRLGKYLLEEVGQGAAETAGVKHLYDELMNIKDYIESICSVRNESQERLQRAMNEFEAKHKDLLDWLTLTGQMYLQQYTQMGRNLDESKHFLLQHHELMQDLEIKGELINLLLETIKTHLEALNPQQRYEVDCKAETLHKHWIELKDLVLKRVDYVSILIDFYESANKFSSQLNNFNAQLEQIPEEQKLQSVQESWADISKEYANVKKTGKWFINMKILDPYIDVQPSVAAVQEIIDGFSKRQIHFTNILKVWTTQLSEKREIEIILEKIMCENEEASNKTKKVDTQLYPVFTTSSVAANDLLQASNEKLKLVLSDIEKAQQEIQERLATTTSIRTNDRESQRKIEEVISNLETLTSKLDGIKYDYKSLLDAIINYLKNIESLQQEIHTYFSQRHVQEDSLVSPGKQENIERTISEHEHFREGCMVKFRALITQSELLIDRIRMQEPPGAKEIDADRILVLLENLRTYFESNCSDRMCSLKRLEKLEQFRCDLNDIHSSLDSVCKQLNEINGQNMESLASAKTTSLAFEYFERTIELLEKRIDQLSETSKEQAKNLSPQSKEYVLQELNKLNDKWANFKTQVRQKRNALDKTVQFYEESEKIDAEYRELSYFYDSLSNKIPYIRDAVEAANLVNDIEKHVISRESALLDKLNQLNQDSPNVNRVSMLYSEIRSLFQSFTKLKFDINIVEERIKKEERNKEAQAQAERERVLQEEQARLEQIKQLEQQASSVKPTELLPAHAERLQTLQDEIDQHRIVSQNIRKEIEVNQIFTEMKYVAPYFTRPLQDACTKEGDKFVFECEVRGYPEPQIEWFKDGLSIQTNLDYKTTYDSGVCRLLIDETLTADTGSFRCRASNILGAVDTTAVLSVRENAGEEQMIPPRIERALESGHAKEGSSFEFYCKVSGHPLPTVQWFKNDKCIDDMPDYVISYNNGEAALRLEEVFLEDDAVYTCRVSNPLGVEHCSARLLVEPLEPTVAPHFMTPLSNVMGRVGQKMKLEAIVNGIPKPDIYWMHNNKPYYPRELKYENESVTLIISQAYPSDAGIYVLTAKNLAGETSCACNVIVKGRLPNETSDSELASDMEPIKPTVQLPLKDISVFEGKPVRLDCVIVGQPEPEVIWYHNERPVKESSDVQLLFQGDRCSLIMPEAYQDDAGAYKVVAINSAGEAVSKCEVKVMPVNNVPLPVNELKTSEPLVKEMQPIFEKFLSDILADEGQTVEMEVLVKGDAPLSAKWFLTNNELTANERIIMEQLPTQGVFKLIIKNVTADDRGVYTVKVQNSAGEAKCFSNLIVKSINASDSQRQQQQQQQVSIVEHNQRPEFKELFYDKGVCVDDMAKFECIVKGKPTPKVRWYFNDQPVQGHNFLVSTSGERQLLTIQKVSTETVGKISCVAENEVGKAVCEAFLSLHGTGLQFPPATSSVQRSTEEYNSGSSVVTIKKQSYQTSSSSQVQTFEGNLPHKEVYHTYAYIDNQPAEVQSHHYEEIHKVRDVSGATEGESGSAASTPTRVRKQIAPRFTTPLQGKIVDQGADVTLEAIYDGFPGPVIKVEKNGEKLQETDRVKIENKCNRVTINLKEVGVPDAGRYAVTATNIIGESTSTADVVVKKTIFPPVFGHRLQAQVLKKGEQLVMEVEVTGLPEPNVTWMKDNKPLQEAGLSTHRLVSLGNSHKLIIEKAQLSDSGKYMVVATNAGGEAKSIADCAVLEPSPERLQEVVKTLVYQQPTDVETKEIGKESITTQTDLQELTNKGDFHGISESKIITEHRCTMEATMRLEHKTSHLDLPKLTKRPQTPNGQDTTDATNQSHIEHAQFPQTYPKVIPTPTQVLPTAGEVTNMSNEISSEQSIKSSLYDLLHRSENSKVENAPKKVQIEIPIKLEEQKSAEFNLQPGTPPEICFAPKIQTGSSVQATIERIEQSAPTKQEPQLVAHTTIVSKDVKLEFPKPVEPMLRATSPKCSAEGAAMTRLWGKPMSNKSEHVTDLNAPFLVQKANYALLEPGSPPEICFAPKPAERRESLVETMERTLEKNLIQGPSKVLPHSVPTLTPPSASPATTQKPTVARPPPPTLPTHLSATRYDIYESDYESDRYKYSGSESDDTSLHPKPSTAEFLQAPLPAKTSGYAADTEDPHTNQYFTSSFEKQAPAPIYYTTSNGNEQLLENEYKNDNQDSYTSSQTCNILYKSNATSTTPSKFAGTTVLNIPSSTTARQTPAEFSDYSSEVEDRFRSVSRNYESETDIKGYRVVFPPTPTPTKSAMGNGHKSPIVVVTPSPMEFEPTPPAVTTYARPKFEPIQKEKPKEYETNVTTNQFKKQTQQTQYQKQNQQQQQHVFKPKPVAAKFLAATQQQQSKFSEPREQGSTLYYNAYAGTPLHTAKMATETTNLTEMESSNTCQRVVNMQRTKQVYHFESQQEKTSSSAQYESYSSPSGASTPAHQVRLPKPPTPTKFTPCEFKESNYKSEFENAKIRPLWSPYGDKQNTRYRHVNAPQGTGRSASLPRSYERVQSPMEFDRGPEMPTNIFDKLRQEKCYNQPNTQTLQRHSSLRSTSTTQKHTEQSSSKKTTVEVTRYPAVGSPPKYGYVASKAQDHGQHMQSTFMQKSSKFMQDISSDMNSNSYTKSQLDGGSAPSYQCDLKTMAKQEGGAPQAYRDETRVSQYVEQHGSFDGGYVQQQHQSAITQHVYGQPDGSPPVFEQIFKNARFAQGGNALFEGKLRGNPKPFVSWTRKGAPLLESQKFRMNYNEATGEVSLLINQIGPGDEGEYTCTARNQFGEAICSVYIQPEGAPMPTLRPVQKIEQKSSYTNGCTYSSVKEEFRVDTFEYRLLREVSFREAITRRSNYEQDSFLSEEVERSLGPAHAPQIGQKPRNSKLVEGSDAVFSAKVGSNPKPRMTWFHNGQRLVSSNKYETNYSSGIASLRVKNANINDAGHYTLLAENTQGCVVASAVLAVEPAAETQHEPRPVDSFTTELETGKALPPVFVQGFANREITEGRMTRFDCRVTGNPYPEVIWLINGIPVKDDASHKILVNEAGSHSLMIINVSRQDAGAVQCLARNKAGEVAIEAQLNVLEKEQVVAPQFVQRFSTMTVRQGEPITMSANAIGTPMPRITWQKDGVQISSTAERYIGIDGGMTCLEIPHAKPSDAGWYQCTAQNVAGSTANRARLYVEVPKEPTATEQRRLNLPRPTKVIEPEPEPEPEIIYLRHVERAKPHLRPGEEERIYPPPQFIVPLQNVQQVEGGRVHFEARIDPVGDPTMVVEWYLNGRPLAASSRATSVFKFGFIALDLLSIVVQDAGEYMCRVTNAAGMAESRAILSVVQRPSIEKTPQNPQSLQYINQLEDYSRYQRQESSEELMNQKPVFIVPLRDLGAFEEGKNAHFEAQVNPVNDPTMRVEWYKDGRPITASSRITAIFNFGYVSLNIMHLRAEDTGSYTVRAVNRVGEAISTSTIRVNTSAQVTADLGIQEQQRYIESVEQLEEYRKGSQSRQKQEAPEPIAPPHFKTQIQHQLNLSEGGYAHFEARLEPIGESTMRVEWLKDGQVLEASSRTTSFFNFGYVALTIKQLTVHDAGTYTCRAYNAMGQDTTTANLTVLSKSDILFESQHPGGLEKIQHLENSALYTRTQEQEEVITQMPRFLGPMKGTNKILEGQRAHFETRVEPQSDLSMKVEWYHNGQPLLAANRIKTYYDFGYVALDISQVRAEDAGVYTVVARNKLGEAQCQGTMVVETRSSIDTSSMHRGLYERTQVLEEKRFQEPQYSIDEISKSKPVFVQPLSDQKPIAEGKNVHLECRLEPMGDPTMRVEWFHNGRPITVGSRFRTYNDFGFVALDIVKATANDSGEYTVRATNHLGSDHTSSFVRVIDHSDVDTETQNGMSLEQIQLLEDSSRRQHHMEEDITIMQAPQFTRPLRNVDTTEGVNVHLECRLQPVGDPTMRVEWFVNGVPVKTGHRFRPAYEFDYVALDLLGCYAADSGVYTCQARNQLGEALTSCSVRIAPKNDLILETQNESGLQKIAYLEDSSRYRRSEFVDEVVNTRPRFLTHPKSMLNVPEGGQVHFECKIEPVTDSHLKVEWFKDGRPITVGHRFRPVHDFGYVALVIVDCIAEDSGIYTCRATNLLGFDETRVELQCRVSDQIVTVTQNEAGLEKIHYLEDRTRYSRREEVDETTKQAPVFTTSLKNIEIKENQRAHFECRLIPVSDPTLRVEWFHNNEPLKSGSRFTETNNFGFVALDIMSCLPEDAGTYTCHAYNAVGEAITSAVAIVHTKKSIYRESQHENALPRLKHLEDSSKRQRMSVTEEVITQAPMFTLPVRDRTVAEGQAVHFEARLIPVGDPNLKVEWLRNGQQIEASNRITTMNDFGYVALNMKYVNPEDSGTYTCRAVNELGQAVTSSTLIVKSKTSIQMETQHEAAMHKIHQLEDHTKYQRREEEEYVVTQAPRFVTKLMGPSKVIEGKSAHYECRIEPYPDPHLKVEWLHNGKPLGTGHRFRTTYDFGFAALDILTVYAEDSGEYTCLVTNKLGEARSSINLEVTTRSSIIQETQHEAALETIHYLESGSRYQRKVEEEEFLAERPQFGRPLRNANVNEGTPVHLEATLTPVNDPTIKVEWFCNGLPIQTGHRFKTTYDFGFVALDILYAHAEDTGTYMCRAKNAVGEAVTTCAVNVTANKTLDLDTMDEQRLEKIRQLETYAPPVKPVVEEKGEKPQFLTPLANMEHLKEGEHAHLECRVKPVNDANLKIEWFCNGKQLPLGHRFRTTHDFGYVALDILYVYGEDTGTYMCKATNLLGEAVNTCNVRVLNRRSMILDTQHPDALEKIQKLESKAAPSRTEISDAPISAPHFTAELRGTTEIYEGQSAHFEAQVQPVHDPNLRIEFYHNGKPLPSASRFHITFDFGYVSLDISHAVAEDAGEYSVRAVNSLGQAVSATNLRVIVKSTIISDSQHPEGLKKIEKLESNVPFQRPEIESPATRQRPVFTQPLQNIDRIKEHQNAHFECHLIPVGDPNLKVEWYRNEKLIEDSSRITKQHEFGFVALDIMHIRKEDEGVYMCRAVNPLGEAVTTASMRVVSEASIQMDTQHPDSVNRIRQLERGAEPRAPEPERIFDKPIFTQLLTGPSELWEGQHAHFEARVVPVGDPTLKFEWFINGVELQMGSRLHTQHDFGFVTLDINSVTAEDSGVYMCRAYNESGEAISSTAMKVKAKSNIDGSPLVPESWEAIQQKEAAMNRVPQMFVDSTPQQAPVFTTHLQSFDKLSEGQHVLLEAQVEPRADPNLRIEWFKNGITLTTGARIRSTFDFGLVTLSINGLRADDSAIYTCKATNQVGEAVSTCSLKIEDHHWLHGESLHPQSLPRIGELEAPKPGRPEAPEITYETPVFISHLNNIECKEGDNVRFECNVEPARDPTMQVEWYYNGQVLQAASKVKTIYDFGFCALDLSNTYAENSGVYTCKATNSKGTASTSGTLKCVSGKTMFLDTQHPQGTAGLEQIQETEEALANRYNRQVSKPETQFPAPVWTRPLQPEFHLGEAQPLHLEANVEPKEDPNLYIEWYFNGKLLQHGSRFKMTSEFGFVTMDVIEIYERDQGIYTCKAYNRAGEAFTTTTVYCSSKESIIERTQHPKGAEGLEQIQDLEESLRRTDKKPEKPEDGMAPQFVTQFTNIADIGEGEIAHYEATLIPTGDQSMVIEWFYNGKVLEASHRVRTIYAFGMVALEILGTKVEDSGTYVCRATNKYGSAECTCTLECVEKPYGQKPHFTSHIQPLEGLKDGQSAHFECTLIPVNDPELKVEWYHNGKLLRHSNRIKTVSDFGYVVLDIAYLQDHDSGEYVCRAYNKYGEDFTRTTLNCRGRGGVFYDTLQPDSLNRIRELECPQPGQADTSGPVVTEPPKFITHIRDVSKLVEGQSAHFEAHLTPVTDPDLKVEWFFNGKKLPHGHRFRTFHDFGIVILDILYCYEENSGVYECRATNKYGSDVTTAKLQCSSKTNLILDSQLPRGMEGGLEKIANLEYSMVRTRDETTEETKGKAPVFTVPLENIEQLREGENAHFEARVTPTDDPRLKVEWYWNGRPLKAGSRFRTFCEFGFVILEISPVYPEDSGEYSCRAINEYGEAVTTATMKIQGKRSIIMESQLPKGMEGTIDRIAQLEGLGARSTEFVEDIDTGKPPEFITSPFDMEITENSLAHFECRLQPINDPSMRVDWFHNGKALWAGSRIKTINDFGFVILEIAGCYQRDSGLYTCKATNKHGEATVSCKLHVKGRQGIIMEPQLPNNFRTGTESLQKLEESIHKREEIVADEEQPSPPKFTEDIKDNLDVPEGGPIHFDCRVEPVGDPTMRIDWFHNGRPMPTGSRVHQLNDFGFIALDIDYIYTRDSGEYTCRATNKWGTAVTKAKVTCRGKQNIIYDSQLPDGISAEKLKELERGRIPDAPKVEDVEFGPPKFVTEISSVIAEEAEAVRFECQVEPKNDPNLRVEWFRNGKLLPSGHRYRNIFDMGFVSLDILYVYAEDSGEYVCRAYNKYGEAFTRAKVSCKQLPTIILQNQVPRGMKRSEALTQMEATIKKYTSEVHLTEDDLFDPDRKQPPRFVTQIKEQLDLTEMSVTKFECQLAPVGDPNMKVEWYFNGKPLLYKNRFQPIYDFGYVAMNFGWVYPEDSGEYVCVATNLYGRDETRAVIKVSGKPGIVYDSQLPAHMQSIDRIREMEASWQVVPEEADPDAKPRSKPTFVSKLEPQTVEEGEPARFCVRVTGHPRPRVMWLINGHTVVHGSRYKLTNDGMFHLDIPKTRQYDTGKVEVIARNSVGEAIASTELKVVARSDDYRSVLKNSPRPWYDYELASYQKERQDTELEKVFDDRKQYLAEQSTPLKGVEHLKPKQIKTEAPEWQQTVLAKKSDDYYSKLQELETEQLLKETKLREDTHQIALPAGKVELVSSKRGSLKTTALTENTEETSAVNSKTQVKKTGVVEPAESSVHAREVYMNKQLQTQKERQGDMEITRKITATETTEMEHKGTVQERVVKGPVQPAKPPVFTKKIQPCRVFENEQAKFEVEFDGEPMPTVKWFRETFPIQNSPDLQIHTFSGKSVLIIRQVFVEDSAVFSCIAENRGGTAKCSANLVVEERRRAGKGGVSPPSFVTTIQSAAVVTGQLARFDAKVTGSKPMDVYWLKNGKKVQPSIKFKMLEEDNVYTLLIIEPLPEDSGHYECVAVNVAGEARCDADCVVQSPSKPEKPAAPGSEKAPHIVEQLKAQSVEEGSKVIFKCRIEGKPTPTARWMRGENIVKPSRYFQMSRQSDNYQLVISEAFPEDEGMYKCIAENKLGSVQTSAQLKVRPMENLEQIHITALKNVSVTEGMPAQFKTVITGKAKPTSVQWFREGALIPETPDFQMIFDGNAAVLLIGTTYEEDSGVFTVRVTSSSGQVESSAKLTVKSKE